MNGMGEKREKVRRRGKKEEGTKRKKKGHLL
jgi:hypothetical protein